MFKHKSASPETITKKRGSDEIKKAEMPEMKYKSQSNIDVLQIKVASMNVKATKGKHQASDVIVEESSMSSSFETESAMLE